MRAGWERLGLRGRLALSFAVIVLVAFGAVFAAVRAQMSHEHAVIEREEEREAREPGGTRDARRGPEDESPIEDAQEDVEKTFLAVGAAALVAALLAGYLVAARAAAPLRRIAATAAEVDAGDLSPRIVVDPAAAAELRVLAESFNRMLDRLEDAFARQRGFVSDASHELRSPLTAIRGQIEVLARDRDPDAAAVRRVEAATLTELERVERLVDQLLALARLDEGAGPTRRKLDARAFLAEAVAGAPGGAELGDLADARIDADPEMLARVVRNLVENARRHAGPGGTVRVSSVTLDGVLRVDVDDDGPGILPAERERVFDRFHRSDAARARASGGAAAAHRRDGRRGRRRRPQPADRR
ncbi:MAG TPA: histidine kinase dimerization/phospho-acceptor domain-containing protein, partial [Solirubrobacterales bacterium]|nr:histidine kinase dimerization/phospho-acceptor domain-containing protein [Solirubrobacterales bacterium]